MNGKDDLKEHIYLLMTTCLLFYQWLNIQNGKILREIYNHVDMVNFNHIGAMYLKEEQCPCTKISFSVYDDSVSAPSNLML